MLLGLFILLHPSLVVRIQKQLFRWESFNPQVLHPNNSKVAIEGSLNILRQTEKAGVTKFVHVSSIITICDNEKLLGPGGNDQSMWQLVLWKIHSLYNVI